MMKLISKKFLLLIIILILNFNLNSWTRADNIQEFEIEGISLYESALKYYDTNELNEDVQKNYSSNKYTTSTIWSNLKEYDYLQLSFKTGDANFIIQDISGGKKMNFNKCEKQLDQLEKEISSLYENSSKIKNDGKLSYDHPAAKSGESKVTDIAWFFENGDVIVIQCYNWQTKFGRKNNFKDSLKIAISNRDIDRWFASEAYQ